MDGHGPEQSGVSWDKCQNAVFRVRRDLRRVLRRRRFEHEYLDFEIWVLGMVNFVLQIDCVQIGTNHTQEVTKPVTSPSNLNHELERKVVCRQSLPESENVIEIGIFPPSNPYMFIPPHLDFEQVSISISLFHITA